MTKSLVGGFSGTGSWSECNRPRVDTRWLEGGTDPNGMRDRYKNNSVLKRVGTPETIAKVALTLPEAGFMTGQVIAVDGGITLRPSIADCRLSLSRLCMTCHASREFFLPKSTPKPFANNVYLCCALV